MYFCPQLGNEGYPRWVPQAVAGGTCEDRLPSSVEGGPLPPNFKVLIVGNSHLRQVHGLLTFVARTRILILLPLPCRCSMTVKMWTTTHILRPSYCRFCFLRSSVVVLTDVSRRKNGLMGLAEAARCACRAPFTPRDFEVHGRIPLSGDRGYHVQL